MPATITRPNPFWERQIAPGFKGFVGAFGENLAWSAGIGYIDPHRPSAGYNFMGFGFGKAKGYNYWTGAGKGSSLKSDWDLRRGTGGKFQTPPEGLSRLGSQAGRALKIGGKFLGPGFTLASVAHGIGGGIEEGGFMGGIAAVPKTLAQEATGIALFTGANRILFKGMGTALKSSWAGVKASRGFGTLAMGAGKPLAGHTLRVAGRLATNPLVVTYAIWAKGLSDIKKDAALSTEAHYNTLAIGNVGNLAAFQTQGAWTSRQMAMQAIQKSHLNARSALGQEAGYMHRLGY